MLSLWRSETLSPFDSFSLSYSSLMTVCSNAPFIDGGQCLLWWCHTTGGKVHRKGDLYNSRAESESPQGCVSVFQCLCVCAAGQRGWWVRTPLIREKTIICENTSFFICSAKSPSRNGSLRRLADAFRCVCVCVHKKPTHIDGPTRSISCVEVWNQTVPLRDGIEKTDQGLCYLHHQQLWCQKVKLTLHNKDVICLE